MQQPNNSRGIGYVVLGAALGAVTSLPVIALSYLAARLADFPFVPFDVFDWLARVLPGQIITLGIASIVQLIEVMGLGRISGTAKTIEQGMGVLLVIAGGGAMGLMIALSKARFNWPGGTVGTAFGALAFLIAAAIELMLGSAIAAAPIPALVWLAFLLIGWGIVLEGFIAVPAPAPAAAPGAAGNTGMSRRYFLAKVVGGSLGLAIIATGIGRFLQAQVETSGAGQSLAQAATPTPPASAQPTAAATVGPSATAPATLTGRIEPAPGTRPEVTANADFYRTDIDTLPLVIDKASWKLHVTGLFDRARDLTLDEIMAFPSMTLPITQSCISNPVAGDLISTTNYTGVRLRDVLQAMGIQAKATALNITSADGFYESVVMRDMLDPRTMLAYGMNGVTLPNVHGFPLRIFIPNHYGMKQPKWITSIEAVGQAGPGYWVDRGWSATAVPQIVSVIDAVAKDHVENGRVPIGGIAWAGDRGIRQVELQIDGGNWVQATLRTPPLSPLTWVEWRYDWAPVSGNHTFTVRATDGAGAMQIEQVADTYPDGATGYHSVSVTI